MSGFIYQYAGPAYPAKENATSATTIPSKTIRTIPLHDLQLCDCIFTPGTSKQSLRLAYFTQTQLLALYLPWHAQKAKLTAPAKHCRIIRSKEILWVDMPLQHMRFYVADSKEDAEYDLAKGREVRDWVLGRSQGETLRWNGMVRGEEEAEKLAHRFAEFVGAVKMGEMGLIEVGCC